MTMGDKESITQLLKETIIQLCKANIFYAGQVEIDGIICISGQVEGQELVIKMHEIFATSQDFRSPYAGMTYPLIGTKFPDFQHLYGDYEKRELKRRRIDNAFDYSRPSYAYSYLSKLIYGRSHPSAFIQPDLDPRNSATDLSVKSSAGGGISRSLYDAHVEKSPSPLEAEVTKYDLQDGTVSPRSSGSPIRSLLGRKMAVPSERWSPNRSFPMMPHCRLCTSNFETSEALSDHNETIHSVFTCLCCFKTFTSRSNLERHSRLHTGHKPYLCNICGKAFSRKDHLSNHATKHAFKCSTCSQRYADKNALVLHYLHDHGAALSSICSFCNKGFSSNELYEEHLKSHPQANAGGGKSSGESGGAQARQHPHEGYACMNCSFATHDKVSLAKHQLVHSDEKRVYTCMGCGKVSEDPLQYSDHLILHQKERDIFECCICRQVCSTISSLRRHEAAHVSEDNSDVEMPPASKADQFQCSECGRAFETFGILQEHLEVHEQARIQFACRSCESDCRNGNERESHAAESGHSGANVEEGTAMEDGAGVADGTARRDKRKQKQPKLMVNVNEIVGTGESDIEVVEPKSPGILEDRKSCDFVITDNPTCVIQVSNGSDVEIKMEPVRSMLSRSLPTATTKSRSDSARIESLEISSLFANEIDLVKKERSDEPHERQVEASGTENRVKQTRPRGRRKGRRRDPLDASGRRSAVSENRASLNGTPDDNALNNNMIGVRNENQLLDADVPLGPFLCAFCSYEANTFQSLDNHCATIHSRSPCMFCSKTFAQKANRDRHHCLHTGDKPYGCPECEERFSRGDKLKMHRIRAHGIQYPLYGSRHKDASPQEQDFAPSPSSFVGSQKDGYGGHVSALYFGAVVPPSAGFDSEDLDIVANPRPDSIAACKGGGDAAFLQPEGSNCVSEFSRTDVPITNKWLLKDAAWKKTKTMETSEARDDANCVADGADD